ncbi:MAG: tryptophan--tRNA ligase, partial [Alphaproteobacteria bacterium]|nr:tryptophan--tRNA ligase [Alphaproteobacteria bacterium]
VTDSTLPHEPKDPKSSTIFQLYTHFGTGAEIAAFSEAYQKGIGWGDAKKELLKVLEERLEQPRQKYLELMADPSKIEAILKTGAAKIRPIAQQKIAYIRKEIGID